MRSRKPGICEEKEEAVRNSSGTMRTSRIANTAIKHKSVRIMAQGRRSFFATTCFVCGKRHRSIARIGTFRINAIHPPMISGVTRESSQRKTAFACAKFSNSQNTAMPNTISAAIRTIFFRLSSIDNLSFLLLCGKTLASVYHILICQKRIICK